MMTPHMFENSVITKVGNADYLDIKIPHLQIAHLGGNLEMGNIKIHRVGGGFKIGRGGQVTP